MEIKYDVFISYSRHDYVDENKNVIPGNEVSKIKETLTKAGITYWFDEEGIYSGDKFTEKIVTNIETSRVFLFLSTKNACESPWTSKEIACADEFGKYIIPVRIDKTPYNKKVMFRIADLSYVDYGKNPEKGRQEIVASVKAFLNELKASEELAKAEELRRKEELERQRRRQEEEKKRQRLIEKTETEIAALESQKTERKKLVLQKEKELQLAQVDLEDCESRIQKLQQRLQGLRDPLKKDEVTLSPLKGKRNVTGEKLNLNEMPAYREFAVGGISFKMIRVEGDTFKMGCNNGGIDEQPEHDVTLNDYYIGETLVTQALWQAIMGDKPSSFDGLNLPVENISWNGCQKFIKQLNDRLKDELLGYTFRLPYEAEWEFAARGGKKGKNNIYAGSNDIDSVAWYNGNSGNQTHFVMSKKANELGLYDMSGNVWEWCEDWYYGRYYSNSPQFNPIGPSSGSNRVIRGGSWYNYAETCRVTCRNNYSPDYRFTYIGFRLALVHQ